MFTKQSAIKIIVLSLTALFLACASEGKNESLLSKTFRGTRLLPDAVNRIYIEKISGDNINSSIKDSFEYSLRKKISLNKKLSVVDSPEKSDLILKVLLIKFSSEPVKFNTSGIAEEKKLRLYSLVWITAASTGEYRIKKKDVESEQLYSDIKPPVMSEFKAITCLTDLLADRIVSVISTGWYLENTP